jgi:S-DNA-T family DNA segregation ATPase FtsK/SpoIIIE
VTGLLVNLGVTRDVPAVVHTTFSGRTREISPAIVGGQPVTFDIRKAPHMLISGTTGSGKSVAIHSILADLVSQHSPETLGLVLVDPKRVELSDYASLPHLVGPGDARIYRDPLDAIAALEWVLGQTEERFRIMEANRARDISAVPQEALDASGQPRSLVIVVDELADLMMATGSLSKAQRMRLTDPEITLARILQIGRAAGVHAILATQRPSSDIVTGVIKANVPTRLVFALQNATDSRVAMGRKGAEELEGRGDALFLPVGARNAVRMRGRWIPDAERLEIVAAALQEAGQVGHAAAGAGQGNPGQSRAETGQEPGAQQGHMRQALSLADLPLPALPDVLQDESRAGSGKDGFVSALLQRRALRRYRRQAERVQAWNGAGLWERRLATGMALLTVFGFLGLVLTYWLMAILR